MWKSSDVGRTWSLLGHANWTPRTGTFEYSLQTSNVVNILIRYMYTGQQCVVFRGKVVCIGGEGESKGKPVLLHDVWMWDVTSPVDTWINISNAGTCSAIYISVYIYVLKACYCGYARDAL